MDIKHLENTHDLSLPEWGPYSNRYIGISHISDRQKGLRFDLSVIPGIFKRTITIPDVKSREPGFFPWEASSGLEYYCNRHELEWKDQVYCDISFSQLGENARLIRSECVNNRDKKQNIILHYVASMNFPKVRPYTLDILRPAEVVLPEGAVWIGGLDYDVMNYAHKRPNDNLMPDGFLRGEVRSSGFVKGRGLGNGFGKDADDFAAYHFNINRSVEKAVILFRYRMKADGSTAFRLRGIIDTEIELEGNEEVFNIKTIPVGGLEQGEYVLFLSSLGGKPLDIDGFAVISDREADKISFKEYEWNPKPVIELGPSPNSVILKYNDSENYYGMIWDSDQFEIRELYSDKFEDIGPAALRPKIMHDLKEPELFSTYKGKGDGHFTDIFLRYTALEPHSDKVFYCMSCVGSKAQVEKNILEFESLSQQFREEIYKAARAKTFSLAASREGEGYLFSQRLMAATTFTNVLYPIYTKRSYIKNYVPNRYFESLYTWDAGFYGIGLAELDIEKAVECLNAYVTEPGDPHAAFIHHGSPVPVQIYLFHELWNKTQSMEMLAYFYPRLKQFHRFLCGKAGSSTTKVLKSNLIKTWDYFYNSGGWDDYPAQVYTHAYKLEKSVTPTVNTAHCIRTAKILKMAALALNIQEDIDEYDEEIRMFGVALQKFSWDDQSGYFGYVIHDEKGKPVNILRHESGINLNMGLDGVCPLFAGICSSEQEEKIIGNIMSDKHLWTPIGISTVDLSAPYYTDDGYWNGSVWMAYQWFLWKALLDIGRTDLAFRIAKTGLDVWKDEVEDSYICYEHFNIKSLRGAGQRNFSGLSSPVMNWFAAYYRPGTMTCGFDAWIIQKEFFANNTSLSAEIRLFDASGHTPCILVAMNPGHTYRVLWNGDNCEFKVRLPGVLEIKLPGSDPDGTLEIRSIEE